MGFMLQRLEVFAGQHKYFVQRNAVGRNTNDATFSLTRPSSLGIPHQRFSSSDFNSGLQGGREGCMTDMTFGFHYLA